ncbi:MAG: ABC transporter permease [Alphaproteobacteria bacterium]|jgi:ribose transport system permease protein|nr:ABC transporter permease [Alphaproteobacteria bacterium]MDP6587985.1 ABC transporter permease [Alphaproteobacteria bacterium]MDP6817804.1 ABC transporter permease [Alphaproteobacteria bacterium]
MIRKTKYFAGRVFVRSGVLPWFLLIAIITFSLSAEPYLTGQNLFNVARQSIYLVMVSMAQMVVLLTAGLDLSVGVMIALTSIVSSMVMVAAWSGEGAGWIAIIAGCAAGFGAGTSVGVINGIGVALFRVPPFMMTFAMTFVVAGIILMITGGKPVYGIPDSFGAVFGYGIAGGVPIPVWITIAFILLMYIFINWTRMGRYLYAIGGNRNVAVVSGVSTRFYLLMAYAVAAALTSAAALMLTARLGGGESNIGANYPFLTLAACLIGGVSFFGGRGRLPNVVMGALLIMLVENGLSMVGVNPYVHIIVIPALLILAVIADNYRQKLVLTVRN